MRSSLFASSCAAAALLALSIAPISLAAPTTEAEAPTPSTLASSPAQTETPTPEASPSTGAPSSVDSTTSSGDTPTGDNISNSEDRSATDDFASLSPEEQIRQRWQEMGSESGVLGAATSGLVPLRDGAFTRLPRRGGSRGASPPARRGFHPVLPGRPNLLDRSIRCPCLASRNPHCLWRTEVGKRSSRFPHL